MLSRWLLSMLLWLFPSHSCYFLFHRMLSASRGRVEVSNMDNRGNRECTSLFGVCSSLFSLCFGCMFRILLGGLRIYLCRGTLFHTFSSSSSLSLINSAWYGSARYDITAFVTKFETAP